MSKQSELDKIITGLVGIDEMNDSDVANKKAQAKQAILGWHNKQVEEVSEQAFKRGYISGGIDELNRLGTGDGIIWSGSDPVHDRINKLKNSLD